MGNNNISTLKLLLLTIITLPLIFLISNNIHNYINPLENHFLSIINNNNNFQFIKKNQLRITTTMYFIDNHIISNSNNSLYLILLNFQDNKISMKNHIFLIILNNNNNLKLISNYNNNKCLQHHNLSNSQFLMVHTASIHISKFLNNHSLLLTTIHLQMDILCSNKYNFKRNSNSQENTCKGEMN